MIVWLWFQRAKHITKSWLYPISFYLYKFMAASHSGHTVSRSGNVWNRTCNVARKCSSVALLQLVSPVFLCSVLMVTMLKQLLGCTSCHVCLPTSAGDECCKRCCYSTPYATLFALSMTIVGLVGFSASSINGVVVLSDTASLEQQWVVLSLNTTHPGRGFNGTGCCKCCMSGCSRKWEEPEDYSYVPTMSMLWWACFDEHALIPYPSVPECPYHVTLTHSSHLYIHVCHFHQRLLLS